MHHFLNVTNESGILHIALENPHRSNTFAKGMGRELADALEEASRDSTTRVVVLSGGSSDRAFCSGSDLERLAELMENEGREEFERMISVGRSVVTTLRQMVKPVIASIGGATHGEGFSLALACDFRIASERASFSMPAATLGLMPDWGATYFLSRLVPQHIASEILLLGDMINAQQAYALGLLNRLVPHDQLIAETRNLADRLAQLPASVTAAIKQAIELGVKEDLTDMLQQEVEAQMRFFSSEETRKRVREVAQQHLATVE